jgi:hypothetical protein
MLQPTFDMKKAFFDRQRIIDAVDRATRKALSKSLAFVRQTARTTVLRRRKRSSSPGQAPSVHSRDPIASLRNILFFYDERTKSGVVGPVKLNGRDYSGMSNTVPAMLESGGTVTTRKDIWRVERGVMGRDRAGRFTKQAKKWQKIRRGTRFNYEARPFMAPSLRIELSKGNISSPWANVISE